MIGWSELVVIALVLLIFVGPRELPGMLRKMGQLIGELKSASHDLRSQVTEEMRDIEQTISELPSPKSLIRDAANTLTDDFRSPYEEAKRAGEEVKDGLSGLKREMQAIVDVSGDGDKASTSRNDDGSVEGKDRKEGPS